MRFQVIVGNVGTVYDSDNERNALFCARTYIDRSKNRTGRVSGEPVTVFDSGEIIIDYPGTNRED